MSTEHNAEQGRIIVIDIDGVLNSETAIALESNIDTLLDQGKRSIILNGNSLTFVTSQGIGAFLKVVQKIKNAGGNAALVELNNEVEALLSVLQISKFLNIYPTKQEAIESFKETFFPSRVSAEHDTYIEDNSVGAGSKFTIDEQGPSDFENPLIIECSSCGSLVRVYRPGDYICPGCKTQFTVGKDGTAVF